MKFRVGRRTQFTLGDDENEGTGSQRRVPGQKMPRSYLSGLLHEFMFRRISISVILLMILLASGAIIMLLNHLLAG
jgi:hypothetical protein